MRITKIETQKRKTGRRNIYVDGRFAVGISEETLLRLSLRTGDETTAKQLKAIGAVEGLVKTKKAALHFLSYRARTVRELQKRLRQKDFTLADIKQVVSELKETGLLDDGEFARIYIHDRLAVRPIGRRMLKQKLLFHGVEGPVADQALDEAFSSFSQEEAAIELARKFVRLRGKSISDPVKLRNRLAGFLARRGFPWEVIRSALRTVGSEAYEENLE